MKDYPILQQLNDPKDLVSLPADQLPALAEEIRGYMVDCVSKNGGHLAASLGAVDLIIALHRVYTEADIELFNGLFRVVSIDTAPTLCNSNTRFTYLLI